MSDDFTTNARRLRAAGCMVLFRLPEVIVRDPDGEIRVTLVDGGRWMHRLDRSSAPWYAPTANQATEVEQTDRICYCDAFPDTGCDFCNGVRSVPVLVRGSTTPLPPFPEVDPDREAAYQAKLEAKRDRYADRADKARSASTAAFQSARVIADGIPMGQPVLVGHHSEKRHRRDLERIDRGMRKGIEEQGKAAYYADKAEGYGTHGVSSDDPAAVKKLRAELAELEQIRAAEKLWNAAMRTQAKRKAKDLGRALTQTDHVEIVAGLAMPDGLKKGLMSYARAFPWLPQFGNGTQANIKRIEKRIAELVTVAAQPDRQVTTPDGTVIDWNKTANRVQITFPGKPDADVIARCKQHGFRWARSEGAWQRHASEGAWYHATRTICRLAPTAPEGAEVNRCAICETPTHPTETDEENRCAACADAAGQPHSHPDENGDHHGEA